jgi:hypothetical protein
VVGLEARVALTTTVVFDPALGRLTVTGDAAANTIAVTATKGRNAATGTIVVLADGVTRRFTAASLREVLVAGGAGNDRVSVYERGFDLQTLSASGDAGDDVVGVTVAGNLLDALAGGATAAANVSVSGDGASATAGNDALGVSLQGLTLRDARVAVRGDGGNDRLTLAAGAVNLQGGTSLAVLGGDGNDNAFASVDDSTSDGGRLAVDGGAGADTVTFATGGLSCSGAGFSAIVDGNTAGGSDPDAVGVTVANASVAAGSMMTVAANGQGGDDTLNVNLVGLRVAPGGALNLRALGGDGNDSIQFVATLALPGPGGPITVGLDGGPGVDSLFLFAPRDTRTGPFTVRYQNFERVRGA